MSVCAPQAEVHPPEHVVLVPEGGVGGSAAICAREAAVRVATAFRSVALVCIDRMYIIRIVYSTAIHARMHTFSRIVAILWH